MADGIPDYPLPEGALAQVPAEPRDSARLLVDRGPAEPPAHRRVEDLADVLAEGDVLVVNETRVLPARLRLRKDTGGAVEVLLLEPEGDGWAALVRPGRRLPPGTTLVAPGGDLVVEVGERRSEGTRRIRLVTPDLDAALATHGEVPLPPYIHAPLADPERYQTVYARSPGSVAAPTAGLHLTRALLDRCAATGVAVATVDLAVGMATFRPLRADDLDGAAPAERYCVPGATLELCSRARRVIAVGTTTVRALEAASLTGEREGRTRLRIAPGHRWGVVDVLLTNFHLPRSSLLLLVEAFIGPRWRQLYEGALAEGYRFGSFGDAMLLERRP